MEENQEQKHVCKFCKKSFRCGRSLGGHMRSHLTMNSAEAEEKLNRNSFMGSEAGGHTSYGLRENPKKTWRLSDSRSAGLEQDKVCKECGKGFQSWKALFGHMRCHSDRERLSNSLGDDSLTSSNQKLVMDSQSDNETAAPRKRRRSKRRRHKIATTSSSFSVVNGSSSVSEIEQEQEEVAMCLMMLSRDVGYWSGLNSVADSSDNNSFVLETRSSGMDQGITKTESIDLVCNGGETVKIEKPRDKNLESGILDSDAFLIKKKIYEFGVSDSQFLRHGVKKVDSEVSMDGFPGGDELKKPKLDDESGNDVSVAESGKYSHIRYKPTEAELGKDSFTVFDQSDSSCRKYNSTKRIMELDYDSRYKVSDAEVGKDLYNSYKFTEAELGKGTIKETGFDQADSRSKKYKPSKRTRRDDWNPELEENSSKRACDGIDSHLCKDARRKSKFECTTCNKIFHSYQALGGHRASHKKIKGCFASRIESSENSIETDISPDPTSDRKLIKVCDNENQTDHEIAGRVETSYAPKKNKEHECPICFKVFASGQALGGHKRSHLVGGSEAGGEQTIVIQKQLPEINDLLDLNLPAAIEEETDGHVGFKPWWVGSSHESEPLVGLISN